MGGWKGLCAGSRLSARGCAVKRPTRVVFLQNELGELGGVSTFCKVVGEGLLARGYTVEVGALEPARDGRGVAYDPRIGEWTAHHRSLARAVTERGSGMRNVRRNARCRFAAYGPETVVIFTQLFVRERTRAAWEAADVRSGFRSIVQYHGSYAEAASRGDVRRAEAVFADADLFLLLTAGDAELFQRTGFNNTGFIPNPISVPDSPLAAVSAPVAVSLGRYEPIKALDQAIRAWRHLIDDFPEWRLDLYGGGPLHSQLEDLVAELDLASSVRLMGRTDNVGQVLAGASINVLSSRYEGLPFALMEASAHGVPSVSFDCAPGVREIIDNGRTGLITPRNDSDALADGLRELMEGMERRRQLGAAARIHMVKNYNLDVVLDRWEETLAEVVR